ncbi:MAG: (Fe-S)-binding protein [Gammaproteobacteria bacterium]|nr:(Fe-S)-binding protein [Gammaproteobacteria bacterium]
MKSSSKLSDTDLCVMCGMCLPNCPTYQLYQTETESPRGRIALIQAIDQQHTKVDARALLHIDHCLSCLNCETICPSKVPYGKIIDDFRDQFNSSIKKSYLSRAILKQSTKPNGLENLFKIANKPVIKQILRLGPSGLKTTALHTTENTAEIKTFYAGAYSEAENRRGEVTLFTGCIGKSSDYNSIKDAVVILNSLGFDVNIPQQQYCCGALHQHNGQQKQASQLLIENQHQLEKLKSDFILFFSPACGENLQQLENLAVFDVRSFILGELQQQDLSFKKPDQPVALHESCSHRNRLKLKTLNYDLINCVPDVHILESSNPSLCCGASGIQSIDYPEQSQALLQAKLSSFELTKTNILISDNIGCSLHIKSSISGYNPNIEIIHPVSFLARQLTINNQPETEVTR